MTKPKIFSKDEWGADPNAYVSTSIRSPVTQIILHHDASETPDDMTWGQAAARMRDHQDYHIRVRGYSDIGYHYVIAPAGWVFEGRSIHYVGAHTYGQNWDSLGICLMGNFEIDYPDQRAIDALVRLVVWLQGQHPNKLPLFPHLLYNKTVCPGKNLYEIMDSISDNIKRGTVGSIPDHQTPAGVPIVYKGQTIYGRIIDGTTYAPVRQVADLAGLKTGWDPEKKIVTLDD